jgi:hypothetical protein
MINTLPASPEKQGKHRPMKSALSLTRQLHLVAGLVNGTGLLLGLLVSPWFFIVCFFPTFGLLLDAATGFCPMTFFLQHMPWNR